MCNRLRSLLLLGLVLSVQMATANAPPPSMDSLFRSSNDQTSPATLRPDESLPAPVINTAKVNRGQVERSSASSLDDGTLWLQVTVPVAFSGSDVGFLFRIASGDVPANLTIPKHPVRSLQRSGDEFNFNFYWQDGAPNQHEPLDFILEISLVTLDQRIGPATRIRVK